MPYKILTKHIIDLAEVVFPSAGVIAIIKLSDIKDLIAIAVGLCTIAFIVLKAYVILKDRKYFNENKDLFND